MQEFNRLSEFIWNRRRFDPSRAEDLQELAYFQKNSTWKDRCPFLLEWPHKDIISMCQVKYTDYMLNGLAQ